MKYIIDKKDYPSGTALMLGRGIAAGKKEFYGLISKKFLNRNHFHAGRKLILIQLEKVK